MIYHRFGRIKSNLYKYFNIKKNNTMLQNNRDEIKNFSISASSVYYRLEKIWLDLLLVDKIEINDSFTSLGGNSVLAARLMQTVNDDFNLDLPLIWFYKHKVFFDQAKNILLKSDISYYSPTIDLNNDIHDNHRIFFLTPSGLGCEAYRDLAEVMKGKIHCVGIDNYNLNSGKQFSSLNEMISYYSSCIESYQTKGPYYLLGWSGGGQLAMEIANNLLTKGKEVKKIYLVDAYPEHWILLTLVRLLSNRSIMKFLPSHIAAKFNSLPSNYRNKVLSNFKYHCKLMLQSKLKQYDGNCLLISSSSESVDCELRYDKKSWHGWKKFLRKIKIHYLDSEHFDFLGYPTVNEVSKIIIDDMKAIQQNIKNN